MSQDTLPPQPPPQARPDIPVTRVAEEPDLSVQAALHLLTRDCTTVRYIPDQAIPHCAGLLAKIVAAFNKARSWATFLAVLMWAKYVLQAPRRAGKGHQARNVKDIIQRSQLYPQQPGLMALAIPEDKERQGRAGMHPL